MIAITTSNSIRVNPRLGRFRGMDTLLSVDGWWPPARHGRRVDRSGLLVSSCERWPKSTGRLAQGLWGASGASRRPLGRSSLLGFQRVGEAGSLVDRGQLARSRDHRAFAVGTPVKSKGKKSHCGEDEIVVCFHDFDP